MTGAKTAEKSEMVGGWSIDKKIPLTLVITVALQFSALAWWGSNIESRVSTFENEKVTRDAQFTVISGKIEKSDDVQKDMNVRLVRVEDKTADIFATVGKIDGKIDKLSDAVGGSRRER